MKHLFNYASVDVYEQELADKGITLAEYTADLNLDGIEQFVYQSEKLVKSYRELTVGVHLNYWPFWMDFWLKKAKRLRQQFRNIQERNIYFHDAFSRDEWLAVIRKNIGVAVSENPEYLLWHVAEATNEEIFTGRFNYTDREVMEAAAEIFNSVSDEIPGHIKVLFENSWWPGLRLTDVRNVKYFFSMIKRTNVGIMLNTGHLMNNNLRLKDEGEAVDYVKALYDKLGECRSLVKGLHLSCSLSGAYQRSFSREYRDDIPIDKIWQHMLSIDQHLPMRTKGAKEIIEHIQPEYVVHELVYDSLEDFKEKYRIQIENCK